MEPTMNISTKATSVLLLLSVYAPLMVLGIIATSIAYVNRHNMDQFSVLVLGTLSLGTIVWSIIKGGNDILDATRSSK
jgi:hypothetical protein